jgi:hypothetical protein
MCCGPKARKTQASPRFAAEMALPKLHEMLALLGIPFSAVCRL